MYESLEEAVITLLTQAWKGPVQDNDQIQVGQYDQLELPTPPPLNQRICFFNFSFSTFLQVWAKYGLTDF